SEAPLMHAPDWLTARPVAHRGLHDIARGVVENMPAAAHAAVDGNFAIECDIQLSSDGEAMVHHDNALGRLTEGSGALLGKTAAELKAVQFKNTPERMMTLGDLCALVAGRVPLVIEVKSHFDGDRRLVERGGEVCVRDFAPCGGHVLRSGPGGGAARTDPRTSTRHRGGARIYRRRVAGSVSRTAPRHARSAPR